MPDINVLPRENIENASTRKGIPDFEQLHLISYMQLADAKASVFLAITSGAVAYIAGHYGLGWLQKEDFYIHSLLISLSMLVLFFSAALDIAVIIPRRSKKRDGIFFYHDIVQIGLPAHYLGTLLEMSEAEIFREKMIYCYDLATICDRKYRLLNYSLIAGAIGYSMFLALLLWQ